MHACLVCQVLLEPFHGFEQLFRRQFRLEVIGRVVRQLLRQIDVRQLLPAAAPLGFVDSFRHHVGQDRPSQRLDSLENVRVALALEPLLLERHEEVIDEPRDARRDVSFLRLDLIFELLQRQQRFADLDDTILHRLAGLRPPRQSPFDVFEHRVDRRFEAAEKEIPNRHRVQHDLAQRLLRPLLRRVPRDERRAIHQVIEMVVRSRDHAFREQDEGALRLHQNPDRTLQGLAIHAFAVHAEDADVLQQPPLEAALHEEMPARHDVDRCADGEPEMRDHHRVARAAVVRRQQDAVPRLDRRLQPVDAQQFVRFDPMARSEERWQDESAQQPGPEGAVVRRHELVGFIDDDVLHAGREPARSLRCSRRGCQTANGQLRRIAQDEAARKTRSQHRNPNALFR